MSMKDDTKVDISVVVCCYNSSQRLQSTLDHLANQKIDPFIRWEVVLVDNNSKDNTTEVAKGQWQEHANTAQLKVFFEREPGLSSARKNGVQNSLGDIIVFCDDDNWLCPTYLQTVYEIMSNHAEIGALGGWCEASFEGEQPMWFSRYARFFAVSKQGNVSGDITNKKGCLYGAGMATTKRAWDELHAKGFRSLLSDRKGESLSSGGDTEYCYALRLLGYKMWYDERLHFQHYMPEGRMKLDYVKRIRKAMADSNNLVRAYLDILENTRRSPIRYLQEECAKFLKHGWGHLRRLIGGTEYEKMDARVFFYTLGKNMKSYGKYRSALKSIGSWYKTQV